MTDASRPAAERLRDIVGRIRRLAPPMNNNPERWHIDKSELARDVEDVARSLEMPSARQSSVTKG